MKNFFVFLLMIGVTSCSTKKTYPPASDGLNAGIEFIGACLKGDFEKADFYMLQDAENKKLLKEAKTKFATYNKEEKKQLAEASIQNITGESLSPTEMIFHYTNSHNNNGGKIKVVQQNNIWLVDFKYKFNPNL